MILAENLKKSYGKTLAIENVSFSVNENELFGLIGPDGAGKTTIFRILTTLLIADKGKASISGQDIVTEYKKIRQQIGYMPGTFSLYQDLSVAENLNFFARIFNTTIDENYHLIKDIYKQIEPFKNRQAGQLSGGMKQKLALSCALIHSPSVLFLDEPTTGVDAVSRMEFWDMLKNLQQNNITIIVSTPYMDEASLCDRVALIQKGKILSIDTPAQIIQSYGADLYSIKCENMFKLKEELGNYENTHSAFRFGDSVHFRPKKSTIEPKEVESYLLNKKNNKLEIKLIDATVEDCFMAKMTE